VTSDLCRRLDEHNEKADPGSFTAKYKTNKLVYVEIFSDPYSAITREKQIKAGSRLKKIELVHSMNPNWEEVMVVQ
jgi:putative endonuclease